jgi:hypothetical protein
MMRAGFLAIGLFVAAAPAQAQMVWTDKGFAAFDVGVQVGSKAFDTETTFDIYTEPATLRTERDGGAGGFFDIRGGYKVWRNLAVGVGLSRFGSTKDVVVSAQIPDPIEHDLLREVSATGPDAKRTETALHFSGTWMIPVTDKIDVGLSGGPSIFFVKNDTVTSLTVTEPVPTATANLEEVSETTAGFHLGVDVRYMLTDRLGVGGLLRYARASTDFPGGKLTAGGLQFGGGLRVRF